MANFFGSLFGVFLGQFAYKYFTSKVDRLIFEYKAEQEIKKRWLE